MDEQGSGDRGGRLWPPLLAQRSEVTWGNFAWFSARSLLRSLNDQVAHKIESDKDGGSIVDRRRMRWMAAQRDRGIDKFQILDLRRSGGLLVIGDPGEMDASQYVLVRDLHRWRERERDRKTGEITAALLMSDIVYPAGDINQWADAVYLPYFGLPRESWTNAWQQAGLGPGPPHGPLWEMDVLALPGNHDWYDGLDGFMFHACAAEPLPEVRYDESELSRRQLLARRLWKAASPPKREFVAKLRSQVADQTSGRHASQLPTPFSGALYFTAADRPPRDDSPVYSPYPPGMPFLPGPYYAADVGGDAGPALVRVVVVDNGITGTIDPGQADWLEQVLSQPDLPKILITGKPLAVNNALDDSPVSETFGAGGGRGSQARTLRSIVQGGADVVAAIAGDTHNYQRIGFSGVLRDDPAGRGHIQISVGDHEPMQGVSFVQVIAGGGGAFMHPTHQVRLKLGDDSKLRRPMSDSSVDAERQSLWPTRSVSAYDFGARLYRWYVATLLVLGACCLGLWAALTWWLEEPQQAALGMRTTACAWTALLLVGVGMGAWLLVGRGMSRAARRGCSVVFQVVVLAGAGALAVWGPATFVFEGFMALLMFAIIVAPVLLNALVPIAAAFPGVLRSALLIVPMTALLVVLALQDHLAFIGLAGGTIISVSVANQLNRIWGDRLEKRLLVRSRWYEQAALAVIRVLPTLVLNTAVLGCLLVWARLRRAPVLPCAALDRLQVIAEPTCQERAADVSDAIPGNALLLLTLVALGLVGWLWLAPLWRSARWVVPWTAWVLVVAIPAVLVTALATQSDDLGPHDGVVGVVAYVLITCGLAAVVFAAALALPLARKQLPAVDERAYAAPGQYVEQFDRELEQALLARDGCEPTHRSRSLRVAGTMCIAGIAAIESLAEARQPPFFKNVLELRARRELTDVNRTESTAVTRIDLVARGLRSERQDADPHGFVDIETVIIRWMSKTATTPTPAHSQRPDRDS